jgi:glutathione S-transferase
MKLYTFPPAPNPAKVSFYLKEKQLEKQGLELEIVMVDFRSGEQNSAEHLARNPVGSVPVLELDDGTFLTESLAIIEYLEELYPDPPMIGSDPLSRARTRTVERDIEFNLLLRIVRIVHATNSPTGQPPNPAIAEAERLRLPAAFTRINDRLERGPFVMGQAPSIADCTLLAAVNFARAFGAGAGLGDSVTGYPHLGRWFDDYALRHL